MPKWDDAHYITSRNEVHVSRRPQGKRGSMPDLAQSLAKSACPHDCPSACSLEVPVLANGRIGRITGARDNSYTLGVVCAKVARYRERLEHPDRLLRPLRRKGRKGAGEFQPIDWDDALDEIAERFRRIAQSSGSEAIWPYHSGGNMGLLQRYGLDRLRNAMRYSRQQTTICVTPAESGWLAGVGKLMGPTRVRWQMPTSSSCGAATRSPRRSMS